MSIPSVTSKWRYCTHDLFDKHKLICEEDFPSDRFKMGLFEILFSIKCFVRIIIL